MDTEVRVQAAGWRLQQRGTQRLAFAAVLLGALGLRLFRLGAQPLWLDEVYTREAAAALTAHGVEAMATIDGTSPLYTLLAALSVGLGRDTEWWLRLPAALAGAAAAPSLFVLTRRMFARTDLAFAAAAAMAIAPFSVWFSQEARGYSLVILACIWLMWCGWCAVVDVPRVARRGWVWSGCGALVAFLGLGAHATFVLMMVAVALVLMVRRRSWAAWWIWALGQMMAVALFLPWLLLAGGEANRSLGHEDPDAVSLALVGIYALMALTVGFSLGAPLRVTLTDGVGAGLAQFPASSLVVGVVGLILGWSLIWVLPRVARGMRTVILIWIFVPIAGLLLAITVAGLGLNVRYVSGAVVPVTMVIAALWCRAVESRRDMIAGVTVALALLWSDANAVTSLVYAKDDLRSAVPVLAHELGPRDTLLITNESAVPALENYGFVCPKRSLLLRNNDAVARTALTAAARAAGTDGDGRTLVLVYREWDSLSAAQLREALRPLGEPVQMWGWPGVRLYALPRDLPPVARVGLATGCQR